MLKLGPKHLTQVMYIYERAGCEGAINVFCQYFMALLCSILVCLQFLLHILVRLLLNVYFKSFYDDVVIFITKGNILSC